jgi:hypothetical protein
MGKDLTLRNFKPFEYRVYNSKKELEAYSGGFMTEEDAIKWYDKQGKWLENHFKRTLILIENRRYKQTYLWKNG